MATVKGTTIDTPTMLWTWPVTLNYGIKSIRISNTDTVNALDFSIATILYPYGEQYNYLSGFIEAGGSQTIEINRSLTQITVFLNSTIPGAGAAFTVENYLTNKDTELLQVYRIQHNYAL